MYQTSFKWTVDPVEALDKLATGIRTKAMRISLNAGAASVKSAVIAKAPKELGHLAASTKIRVRNYQKSNVWVAIVGAGSSYKRLKKTGAGKTVKKIDKKTGKTVRAVIRPAKYQKFVDQGRKGVAGRKYLVAAYNASHAQFLQVAAAKLRETIEQLIRAK